MIVENRPIAITDNTKFIVEGLMNAFQIVVTDWVNDRPELRAITKVDKNMTLLKATFFMERTIISAIAATTPTTGKKHHSDHV
jgi:hypothetical protein